MMNESVTDIVSSVWQALLGLEVMPAEAPPSDAEKTDVLSASIRISGAWSGAVVAQISYGLARRAASIMLDQPLDGTSIEDARDCMGELVNMFGGNLKALLPGPCSLSLPQVSMGSSRGSGLDQLHEMTCVALESEGATFTVTVLSAGEERAAEQEAQL